MRSGPGPRRLARSEDFERLLRTPPRARSEHFAVHHLNVPDADPVLSPERQEKELSTKTSPSGALAVDIFDFRVGVVVPKRHAKRAVTRSLLKRQIRGATARLAGDAALPTGLWLVRLRAPFDRQLFPSAASDALRRAARAELDAVLRRASGRVRDDAAKGAR